MKNKYLSILFLVITPFYFAQLIKKDEKKISKVLGTDFFKTDNFMTYDFTCKNCGIDTSMTFLNDTSGVHIDNEFVIFRDPMMWWNKLPDASYLNSRPVTVKEYHDFMQYVADSIKVEMIINSFDEQISNFTTFNPDPKEVERLYKEKAQFLQKIRPNGNIYHKTLIDDWDNEKILAANATICLPQPERFYKKNEVDERKLCYRYVFSIPTSKILSVKNKQSADYFSNEIQECEREGSNSLVENLLPISPDYFRWGSSSKSEFDIFEALAYTYKAKENQHPIFGLTGMQVLAFCNWKTKSIQATIDSLNLPYRVHVSLPQEKDVKNVPIIKTLNIPAADLTKQWTISASDYKAFVDHVLDSIAISKLYLDVTLTDENANKLIHYPEKYFDEGDFSIQLFNSKDRELNLSLFRINYDNLSFFKHELDSIKKEIIASGKFYFVFYKKDFKNMNLPGKYWWNPEPTFGYQLTNESQFSRYGDEEYKEVAGEDVGDKYPNCLGFSSGVKWFESLQRFNVFSGVNPLEGIEYNKLLINKLSDVNYEQAKAYFIWKSKIWTAGEDFNYSRFIFPTEEEFQRVQKGENIKIPEMKIELPTPTFRYVVHLYRR